MNARKLHVLPHDTADAAGNMVSDLLLLEAWSAPEAVRLRHYSWNGDCFTFGYGQPFEPVRVEVEARAGEAQICRRPTGGGVVDHRHDWTYALVIPAGHALVREPALTAYETVHQALADAFGTLGQKAALFDPAQYTAQGGLAQCFVAPSPYDVVIPGTPRKLAGAAMKRNRHGLLLQGSVDRAACSEIRNWKALTGRFARYLSVALNTETTHADAPAYPTEIAEKTETRFRAPSWNTQR